VNAAAPDTAVATRAGAPPETDGACCTSLTRLETPEADPCFTPLPYTTGVTGMPIMIAGVCARVSRAIAASPVAFGCTG